MGIVTVDTYLNWLIMKFFSSFLLACLTAAQVVVSKPNSKADHVKLTLYYESLCGGCHQWITGEFHETYVDIITCIEDSADITSDDTVKKCLTDSFVPVETIQNIITCWEGDEGIQLHHENGVKTEQLVPPHEYVPWVTFNDEHSDDDSSMYCQDDLCRCLCNDYLMDVPECQGDILDFCIFSKDKEIEKVAK